MTLHSACVGLATKSSFIKSFDFICKHCFEGSHLFSHQTFFNRSSLILIFGIEKSTILKKQRTKQILHDLESEQNGEEFPN